MGDLTVPAIAAASVVALAAVVTGLRRRSRRRLSPPPWRPGRGGDLGGDREPRLPTAPALSGAAALPLPGDGES